MVIIGMNIQDKIQTNNKELKLCSNTTEKYKM